MTDELRPSEVEDLIKFQLTYQKQRMKSTWLLATVIVGFYLLEEYFGGSQNISVLVRMGANVRQLVREGEYYRMLTAVFLHAGFWHVFFNTYVLFAFGGFFNRILGEARYLTVFLFSGITGSLASIALGKATVSVGASGGIWGLFGASLALALFKTPLLPEPVRLKLRRVMLINVLINLGISFLPMIDICAHIGGGIGGFFLSLFFIFFNKSSFAYRVVTWFFMGAAFVLSALYAVSFYLIAVEYAPWSNQLNAPLRKVTLTEVPFSILVPEGLTKTAQEKNNSEDAYYIFGDLKLDQIVIELRFLHEDRLKTSPNERWLNQQKDALLQDPTLPADVKKTIYLKHSNFGDLLYFQQPMKNTGVIIHNYLFYKERYAIKIGFISSSNVSQKEIEHFASPIIDSIEFSHQ